jgi:hypothetical protein
MSAAQRKSPSAAAPATTPTTNHQTPATPPAVVGLPGQALFNRHFDSFVSVYHFVSRALGAVLILMGVATATNADWGHALFGEIRLLDVGAEAEPGSDEEGVFRRGEGLLLGLIGIYVILHTIPARKPQGGGNSAAAATAAAAAGSGPKAGKAE